MKPVRTISTSLRARTRRPGGRPGRPSPRRGAVGQQRVRGAARAVVRESTGLLLRVVVQAVPLAAALRVELDEVVPGIRGCCVLLLAMPDSRMFWCLCRPAVQGGFEAVERPAIFEIGRQMGVLPHERLTYLKDIDTPSFTSAAAALTTSGVSRFGVR